MSNWPQRRGEAEVVRGDQLSAALKMWVKEYLADRPLDAFNVNGRYRDFAGPLDVLSSHTGINVRRVQGLVNGEYPMVSLSQADVILQAAGLGYKLGTGEIQVVPNPHWSLEKWVAYMSERGCV